MKANCKSEDLEQLKTRCEVLIRNCIVGLLAQLSDEDFKSMEGMFHFKLNSTQLQWSHEIFFFLLRRTQSSSLLVSYM